MDGKEKVATGLNVRGYVCSPIRDILIRGIGLYEAGFSAVLKKGAFKNGGEKHLVPEGGVLVNLAALEKFEDPLDEAVLAQGAGGKLAVGAAFLAGGPGLEIAAGGVVDDISQSCGAVIGVVVVEVGAVFCGGVDREEVDDGFFLGGGEVEAYKIVGAPGGL